MGGKTCNVVHLNSFCSNVAKQVQVHVFVARFVVPLASPRASFPFKNRESHRSGGGEPQKTNVSLFPSSKVSHFQNETKCKTFLVKMSFMCRRIKRIVHINSFAPSLALKQRLGATRK